MFLVVISALLALPIAFYFYMTKNHNFFSSRGVKQVPPVFPWGSDNHKLVVGGKLPFVTASCNLYK